VVFCGVHVVAETASRSVHKPFDSSDRNSQINNTISQLRPPRPLEATSAQAEKKLLHTK